MGLTGKSKGETFKDLLYISNNNSGIDSTLRSAKTNDASSPLLLSSTKAKIQSGTDSSTMFQVAQADGTVLFTIDTSGKNILMGASQVKANTQFAYFGISSADSANIDANYHFPIPFITGGNGALTDDTTDFVQLFGGGGEPSSIVTIDTEADDLVSSIMYVPTNIYIDSVNIMVGGDAASGDTIRFHLMSYDMVKTDGSTAGNLSAGVVVGDHTDVSNDGYEQIDHIELNLDATNRTVNAEKVLMLFFRCDSANSDYAVNATIQYHLI